MVGKYKLYPAYNPSGVEWLGDIPSGWELVLGKRVFSNRREQALKDDQQLAASQTYGVIPQSLMMQLNNAKVMLALKGTESFRHVAVDDFVISLRSFEGGIEHSSYAGCVSPAYTVLCPIRKLVSRFFRYLMKCCQFISALQSTTDSLRDGKSITYHQFGMLSLGVPSLVEQLQIADFLDYETAKIDELIAKQQLLIKLLEEKRQAVISHAVTKGLNPNAPMRPSDIDWLGDIPAHWEMKKLKYLCNFSGGGTPSKEVISFWQDGTIPWVSPKDMKHFYLTDTQDKITPAAVESSSTNYVESGALLMVVRSGILQRTIPIAINQTRVTLNQDMKAIRFNDKMTTEYAANYILGHQNALLLAWSKEGATVESIEQEYLSQHLLPVPPISEQEEICAYLKTQKKLSKVLRDKAQSAIDLLTERRTALISAAVTGKIDVRNWQPQQFNSAQQFEATETIGA